MIKLKEKMLNIPFPETDILKNAKNYIKTKNIHLKTTGNCMYPYPIDENYNKIDNLNDVLQLDQINFWTFNVDKKDFFLLNSNNWLNIRSESYKISISGNESYIPADYFVIIGDYDKGLDLISPKELVGREFEAVCFDSILGRVKLSNFNITGYNESVRFSFPVFGNNLLPVKIGNKIILLSNKNIYTRLKKLTLSDFS